MRNLTRSPFQRGAQPRRSIMPANSYAEGAEEGVVSILESIRTGKPSRLTRQHREALGSLDDSLEDVSGKTRQFMREDLQEGLTDAAEGLTELLNEGRKNSLISYLKDRDKQRGYSQQEVLGEYLSRLSSEVGEGASEVGDWIGRQENILPRILEGVGDVEEFYKRNRDVPIEDIIESEHQHKFNQLLEKIKRDYPEVRPRTRGMAQGGLASIPRYAEGDEVEIEEPSTGEDILEFLANFGGAADGPSITDLVEYFSEKREGPSLQDAIDQLALMGGMPKGMSKGGVVPGSNPVQGTVGGPTVGFSCFIAGTQIMMDDHTTKNIEDVKVGDMVHRLDGKSNKVLELQHSTSRGRRLVSINDGPFFMTEDHPVKTDSGWRAANADMAKELSEYLDLDVTTLAVGDKIIGHNGWNLEIRCIDFHDTSPDTPVYNFALDGDHEYFADGLLVHNRCFKANIEVLLADGSSKKISDIKMGDVVLGGNGKPNTVLKDDSVPLSSHGREPAWYGFNKKGKMVTAEHPLMTQDGWKAIDPKEIKRLKILPGVEITKLKVGDVVQGYDNTFTIESIEKYKAGNHEMGYNYGLDGDHTYYVKVPETNNWLLAHNRGGLAQQAEKNMRLFNSLLGGQYKDLRHYQQSRGHSFGNPAGSTADFLGKIMVEKNRLDAQKQTAPPPPAPKPKPTLPQTFPELQTAPKVDDPGSYVAGVGSLDELFNLYHPGSVSVTNITESESEDPDYAAQAAALYAGGEPTGLGLPQEEKKLQLLKLAGLA